MIEGIKDYKNKRMTILNANGTIVWEGANYDNEHTIFSGLGKNQQQLPAETYYYILEIITPTRTTYQKGYFVLRY